MNGPEVVGRSRPHEAPAPGARGVSSDESDGPPVRAGDGRPRQPSAVREKSSGILKHDDGTPNRPGSRRSTTRGRSAASTTSRPTEGSDRIGNLDHDWGAALTGAWGKAAGAG